MSDASQSLAKSFSASCFLCQLLKLPLPLQLLVFSVLSSQSLSQGQGLQ